MRIIVLGMMLVVILASVALADSGGPDAYGYSWVDNDNGGGPAYSWIDISNYSERITGLTDDNVVGPFGIGFDFPYYWYNISQFWIGSNGYIEFSTNYNFVHPFSVIPSTTSPNNYMAVLAGDLDFSRGSPACYFYTNHVDSVIISWLNVGEFSHIESLHTFQVILCAVDSSITYQYGPNHGIFLDNADGTKDVIGIEDVTGSNGLQYLRENLPAENMWHNGLAIKFHPEPNPNFQIHDFGVFAGLNNSSGAIFVKNGTSIIPRGLFKNIGTFTEHNLQAQCLIRENGAIVYNQTENLANLLPSGQIWFNFPLPFVPATNGVCLAIFRSILDSDQNSTNNTQIVEIDAYSLPSYLQYCDNSAEFGNSWTGNNRGYGVEFAIPEPIRVVNASFYVNSITDAGTAFIWFLGDGGGGMPDLHHPLFGDTITVNSIGWNDVNLPDSNKLLFAADELFFMVVVRETENTFTFGIDQTQPLSNRGWEYYNRIMIPDISRKVTDIMFKIYADTAVATFCPAIIGDINSDSIANGLDITAAVNYFRDQSPIADACFCGTNSRVYVSGDVNGNCVFNGIDVSYYVNYFKGGPAIRSCPSCRFVP